jgi:hypothetical protein
MCAGEFCAEPEAQLRAAAANVTIPIMRILWSPRPRKQSLAIEPTAQPRLLTTAPNAMVAPIHPKAMPVILTTDEERDVSGCAHHGTKRRGYGGRCRITF